MKPGVPHKSKKKIMQRFRPVDCPFSYTVLRNRYIYLYQKNFNVATEPEKQQRQKEGKQEKRNGAAGPGFEIHSKAQDRLCKQAVQYRLAKRQLNIPDHLFRNLPPSSFSITSSFSDRLIGIWSGPIRISVPSMLSTLSSATI